MKEEESNRLKILLKARAVLEEEGMIAPAVTKQIEEAEQLLLCTDKQG